MAAERRIFGYENCAAFLRVVRYCIDGAPSDCPEAIQRRDPRHLLVARSTNADRSAEIQVDMCETSSRPGL